MMKRLFFIILLCLWGRGTLAQSTDYDKAMDDILADYLSDYPEPSVKAFDRLFADVVIDDLPVLTQFLYHYYYGWFLEEKDPDAAIEHFQLARKIATSDREVGIRNALAMDAEMALADLYAARGTDEYRAAAVILYNDIITVGISLVEDQEVGGLVVSALIKQAKMGVGVWMDEEWVKKIWTQARDLAMEINDGTFYSYYVLGVLHHYCDMGEYDTAMSFMQDAKNKEILMVDAASYCQYISDIKKLLKADRELLTSKGNKSLDYWSNRLGIAAISTVLCSDGRSIELLQEVERGLTENDLTESYEYAQVLHLLSNSTLDHPEVSEQYFVKQVKLLETAPRYFVYLLDTDLFNYLAVCQMKQGKYSEAQENYQKALACLERDAAYSDQPGYKSTLAIVYHNIGRNLYFLGKYEESVGYFSKSVTLQEEANGSVMQKTRVYMAESIDGVSDK